jgi:hypothetical protein
MHLKQEHGSKVGHLEILFSKDAQNKNLKDLLGKLK